MISSVISQQLIRSGRVFQLIFFIVTGILTYISYTFAKQGRTWEIRPLEGLEAIYEGIGRAAEMGRPIMVLPGISNLGNPQTLAGLTVLGEVTEQAADIGVRPVTSASNTSVVTAMEAIVRSSFTAAGKPELYSPGDYVQWFGGDQFAYAVGAAGQIMNEKPAVIVYCGYFLFDVIVDGETGQRVGAVQVGGTIGSMSMVALFCDYLLIGEELYAASAQITRDPMALGTLVGQDWIKLVTIIIMVLGSLFSLAGIDVITNLLGM
jgi:hypothetical protein